MLFGNGLLGEDEFMGCSALSGQLGFVDRIPRPIRCGVDCGSKPDQPNPAVLHV